MISEKKNILVFPCGSEVGLEIHRSLQYSNHFNVIGASSVDDHGRFIFENYIPNVPFYNDSGFIPYLKILIQKHNIHALFPAMDGVLVLLKEKEEELDCKIICSQLETVRLCLSKKKTYKLLKDFIKVPKVFKEISSIKTYPVFLKPEVGYGSRGILKAFNQEEVLLHLGKNKNQLILEYLPGAEFTVDCFTNFNGQLLFIGPRVRNRTLNGISANTISIPAIKEVKTIANIINNKINFNGAWFFQIKEDSNGKLCLLEIASRIAGSSSVNRIKGVNFALLSIFNAFGKEVQIVPNNYEVELDRALSCKFILHLDFQYVYVDFDDTLIINDKLNVDLISCLYSFINKRKKIILITKHLYDINSTLNKWRILQLFDQIIHLSKDQEKHEFIKESDAIFIDDSHLERSKIVEKLNIPVFAPDMVQALI